MQSELVRRHNQQLEQDTLDAEEAKVRLQKTADNLSQRLDAIMKDRFSFKSSAFDADTPVDKTLNFLSDYIGVSAHLPLCLDPLLHTRPILLYDTPQSLRNMLRMARFLSGLAQLPFRCEICTIDR